MTNVLMLGGNGYLGRNVTKVWMQKDPNAVFYVVSRSGKNQLKDERIINIQDNVTSAQELSAKIPVKIDYIVDFIGFASKPKGSQQTFMELNMNPAKVMVELAKEYQVKAQGYISGSLGSKEFKTTKEKVVKMLTESGVPTKIIAPTLVYGDNRHDQFTKLVPFLKFAGIFAPKLKPVKVEDAANQLVAQMIKN